MLANVAMRQWLASPQRRSRAATDWPGVRPISPARCPIPMPIPTREPLPLGRRAERAWLAPTWGIGRTATFRRMAAREPARATNAGGPAARDECVGHERERGRSARPLAIASSAASDRRGGRVYWHTVPPLLLVARPWSAAPRRGRLVRALGQRPTRARPDAPLGCRGSDHAAEHHGARRTMPACPCTWRRPAAPAPPFYRLPPSPTLPTSAISLPSCLSRPSRRAPCHWPASHDRSTPANSSHTTLPSLADSVGVLPRAVREGGYSSARGKCGRAPLGRVSWAGTGTREISRLGIRLGCTLVHGRMLNHPSPTRILAENYEGL